MNDLRDQDKFFDEKWSKTFCGTVPLTSKSKLGPTVRHPHYPAFHFNHDVRDIKKMAT
jgi:hypothetical protein